MDLGILVHPESDATYPILFTLFRAAEQPKVAVVWAVAWKEVEAKLRADGRVGGVTDAEDG